MEQNMTKDTKVYWQIAGGIVAVIGFGYLYSMYRDAKNNAAVLTKAMQKKELEEIISQPSKLAKADKPYIVSDSNNRLNNAVSERVEVEEIVSERAKDMSDNAFSKGYENIAQPMEVIKEKPKVVEQPSPPVQDNKLPQNAYAGLRENNDELFVYGDVAWAYKNQNVKHAQAFKGSFIAADGTTAFKHKQKLGTIHGMSPYGAFVKLSPDYKNYGYVLFTDMYKLG